MKRQSLLFSALCFGLLTAFALSEVSLVEARGARQKSREREDTDITTEDMLSRGDKPWYFYYQTGKEAGNAGNWQRAKENFLLAISVDPEPGVKKRIRSSSFSEYFPYYKLSEAYYHLGDIQNAEKYLRISENKGACPKDMIGSLWQLIIEGRKEPQVFLFTVPEQTAASFVDIKGIAFDYHKVTGITVGDRDATIRAATKDEVKALPYEPKLGFVPLDTVYFELLGYPLNNLGENRITIRGAASNPDRKSKLLELVVFKKQVEGTEQEAPADAAPAEEAPVE